MEDRIDSFDFLVDEGGLTHLVWVVSGQLWYRRGDIERAKWEGPQLLADTSPLSTGGPPVRILHANGGLHILTGYELRHFWSGDGGKTWSQAESLLRPDEFARSYDVRAVGNALLVSYVSNNPMSSGGLATDSLELWTARLVDGVGTRFHVGSLSGIRHCLLTMLVDEGGAHLFLGLNRSGRVGNTYTSSSRIIWTRSSDGGRTWAPPDESSEIGSGYIRSLQAVRDSGFTVFYSAPILARLKIGDTGVWSASQYMATKSHFLDTTEMGSIIASSRGGRGYLLWIDNRYTRRDWIFDLLLQPRVWANNDVEFLTLNDAAGMGEEVSKVTPSRLTTDLSMATMVRAFPGEKEIYVMWAGRSKVGRSPESAHRPPEFFYTNLPLRN